MSASHDASTPVKQIQHAFQQGHPALMPYFTLGYPSLEASLEIIEACVGAGADQMELGVPFSDPLADGPTIQHSSQSALANGISVARCLEAVAALRRRGVQVPLVLMSYYNPPFVYGLADFVTDAAGAGANGLIIPDLPPEEADKLLEYSAQAGMGMSFMISPNSPANRVSLVCKRSSGFTYLVSVTGITGAREALPEDLKSFVMRVRQQAQTPLAVGFGISTPTQVKAVASLADGVIVGSALIRCVDQALAAGQPPDRAASHFIAALRSAIPRHT